MNRKRAARGFSLPPRGRGAGSEGDSELVRVEGLVFAIDQTATHDGPGLRMTVYLKGCPLRCVWCHSPESVSPRPEVVWYERRCVRCGACVEVCEPGLRSFDPLAHEQVDRNACLRCGRCVEACPQHALEMKGGAMTAGEVAAQARRLEPFFRHSGGGITLTGGEPALQPDFAYAVLALCRADGIHTALETTGCTAWERLRRLATVTDLFLYDLKHPDEERHRAFTGAPLPLIADNLARLIGSGAEVLVRVPVIPGYNGDAATLRALGRLARDLGAARISLLPFNPAAGGKYAWLQRPYLLNGVQKQSDAEMRALEAVVRQEGLEVVSP